MQSLFANCNELQKRENLAKDKKEIIRILNEPMMETESRYYSNIYKIKTLTICFL